MQVHPPKPAMCKTCGELESVTFDVGDDSPLGVRALCPECRAGAHVRNEITGKSLGPLFLSRATIGLEPRVGYWAGRR